MNLVTSPAERRRMSPPKHKTPNYRLVTIEQKWWDVRRNCWRHDESSKWEAMPLRADRKDLP